MRQGADTLLDWEFVPGETGEWIKKAKCPAVFKAPRLGELSKESMFEHVADIPHVVQEDCDDSPKPNLQD